MSLKDKKALVNRYTAMCIKRNAAIDQLQQGALTPQEFAAAVQLFLVDLVREASHFLTPDEVQSLFGVTNPNDIESPIQPDLIKPRASNFG